MKSININKCDLVVGTSLASGHSNEDFSFALVMGKDRLLYLRINTFWPGKSHTHFLDKIEKQMKKSVL